MEETAPLEMDHLRSVFEQGLAYPDYVAMGTSQQQDRWRQVYQAASVTAAQRELLRSFVRRMNILVVSGVWCGDCVEQCPLLARLAEACPLITLRFVDRDAAGHLADALTINQGRRVPVVLFLAEDYAFCGLYGDRSLTRYRALARRQTGSACSTGLFAPDAEELAATLQDWLDEIERIQLMLRLSGRLREKHGD